MHVRYEDRQKAKEAGMVWASGIGWVDRELAHKPRPKIEGKKDFRKDMREAHLADDAAAARKLIAPDLKRLEKARRKAERNLHNEFLAWLSRPLEDMLRVYENLWQFVVRRIPEAMILACIVLLVLLGVWFYDQPHHQGSERSQAMQVCENSNAIRWDRADDMKYAAARTRDKLLKRELLLRERRERQAIMNCETLTDH